MILGVVAALDRKLMTPVYIAILLYFLYKIFVEKNKQQQVLMACAYVAGAEIFFRMTKTSIFWETGKYAIILYCLIGIFYLGFKRNSVPYILYFLFLLPAVVVSYNQLTFDVDFRKSVLFNLSGPFCLVVAAVFMYGRTVTLNQLLKILDYLIYPVITTVVYIVLYSPSIKEAVQSTASNAAVSGGYSGNQVSTILGLGFFILLTRFFLPYKNVLVQGVMMFFMALMGYRALLTFSRGGVVVAILIAVTFILVYYFKGLTTGRLKPSLRLAAILFGAIAIWGYTEAQTGGMIGNRYANKDALGQEKEDVTTGRGKLMEAEFDAFSRNPVLGIGAGRAKIYFDEELDTRSASHNEITRMFAEHGLFGILSLLTLIFAPFISILQGRRNLFFLPFLAFWFLTIGHSSMRIALPAFVYALCLLNVTYETEKKIVVRRKSTNKTRIITNIG